MDETYGTYVDDECFDIHDYDDDDTDLDADDDADGDTDDDTDKTSLWLIRRIGGGGKGPHWIDIGLTLDSHWIHW